MIRIGLLGASRIARGAVIGPAADIDGVSVTRIAASDRSRAREYADEHGIPGVEADYAALVASDEVDLVYNALPPSGHCEWTMAALDAGKHVLCEKPFAMNAEEAEAMVSAAASAACVLIEAFHYRFHPLFETVLAIVRSGELGVIRDLEARFTVPIRYRAEELRYRPELGGGSMMDLGCYPLHWVRTLAGSEPLILSATAERHASGVDLAMRAELEFPQGAFARIASAMGGDIPDSLDAWLKVDGELGHLVVDNPLAPHNGHELLVATADGERRMTVDGRTTYHHQLEHVRDVITGQAQAVTGGEDAVATMRAIDAIYAASGLRG